MWLTGELQVPPNHFNSREKYSKSTEKNNCSVGFKQSKQVWQCFHGLARIFRHWTRHEVAQTLSRMSSELTRAAADRVSGCQSISPPLRVLQPLWPWKRNYSRRGTVTTRWASWLPDRCLFGQSVSVWSRRCKGRIDGAAAAGRTEQAVFLFSTASKGEEKKTHSVWVMFH